jgi:ribonuclease P protein component
MTDEGTRRNTFPPSRRIGGLLAFRNVFDNGVKASQGPLTVYLVKNDLGHPRLGMTVPRRVGNAVRRNRVKRMLRDAFRHLQHDLPAADIVILVRPHEPLTLGEYQRLMDDLVTRLKKSPACTCGAP